MRHLFLIPLFAFIHSSAFGEDPEIFFQKGNALYQQADYGAAAKEYEKILQQGFEGPEVYFNLGNAYYKMDKIPEAILNYERALKLAPNDTDVKTNLKIANLKTVDKISETIQTFPGKWWHNLLNLNSPDSWAKIALAFLFISVLLIIVYFLTGKILRKISFFTGAISFLTFLFLIFLAHSAYKIQQVEQAIIFSSSTYVKSAPDEKSTDLFILHEGAKVTVMEEVNKWKKINLPNGNEGWLKAETLEII